MNEAHFLLKVKKNTFSSFSFLLPFICLASLNKYSMCERELISKTLVFLVVKSNGQNILQIYYLHQIDYIALG